MPDRFQRRLLSSKALKNGFYSGTSGKSFCFVKQFSSRSRAVHASIELDISEIKRYLPQIEKFAPARAAQIRQKINAKNAKAGDMHRDYQSSPPLPGMPIPNAFQADAQEKLIEDVGGLNTKTLSKDEKQKVIEKARKIIADVKTRV